jgi:plastocyanin
VLASALVFGCRGAPAPPPPPPIKATPEALTAKRPLVSLKVLERTFEPRQLTLDAGVPVTISIANTTAQDHNLTIKDPEGHRAVDMKVPVGQTLTVPFVPSVPGIYIFYCKFALHRTFGEEGTIEVR